MINIIIPMAGEGNRFKKNGYTTPKPIISVENACVKNKTLIEHSIETLGFGDNFIFITKSFEKETDNDILTKIFYNIKKPFIEVRNNQKHFGAAHSALLAEEFIDPEKELIVTNCDQFLSWNPDDFIDFVRKEDADGAVLLYKSEDIKNSFALIENNKIIKITEKNPISSNALVGVHYWKKAKYFFNSAKMLFEDFKKGEIKECYVSLTYNYMIANNKKIVSYFTDGYFSLGTPEDLEKFKMLDCENDNVHLFNNK